MWEPRGSVGQGVPGGFRASCVSRLREAPDWLGPLQEATPWLPQAVPPLPPLRPWVSPPPLTGSQSANGKDMLRGAQLAAMQVNARGGVLGRTIKVVGVDDRADPALGA